MYIVVFVPMYMYTFFCFSITDICGSAKFVLYVNQILTNLGTICQANIDKSVIDQHVYLYIEIYDRYT